MQMPTETLLFLVAGGATRFSPEEPGAGFVCLPGSSAGPPCCGRDGTQMPKVTLCALDGIFVPLKQKGSSVGEQRRDRNRGEGERKVTHEDENNASAG